MPASVGTEAYDNKPDGERDSVVGIFQRVLGPLAIELWGARKLHQLERELRRAREWKEVRAVDDEFERFWAIYPRKADQQRAARAFRQARRQAGRDWPMVLQQIMLKAPHAGATAVIPSSSHTRRRG